MILLEGKWLLLHSLYGENISPQYLSIPPRCLGFDPDIHYLPYFMCANSYASIGVHARQSIHKMPFACDRK